MDGPCGLPVAAVTSQACSDGSHQPFSRQLHKTVIAKICLVHTHRNEAYYCLLGLREVRPPALLRPNDDPAKLLLASGILNTLPTFYSCSEPFVSALSLVIHSRI